MVRELIDDAILVVREELIRKKITLDIAVQDDIEVYEYF